MDKLKEELFNLCQNEISFQFVFLLFWMKKAFCLEYYSIIACGLTDLNTWTFESSKKIFVAL